MGYHTHNSTIYSLTESKAKRTQRGNGYMNLPSNRLFPHIFISNYKAPSDRADNTETCYTCATAGIWGTHRLQCFTSFMS